MVKSCAYDSSRRCDDDCAAFAHRDTIMETFDENKVEKFAYSYCERGKFNIELVGNPVSKAMKMIKEGKERK